MGIIYKKLQTNKASREFQVAQNVVCVDYNYLNWIRTYLPRKYSKSVYVIPNFAKVSQSSNRVIDDLTSINILFARRFEAMRGVDIMIDIVKELTVKYKNLNFTLAGEGSLEHKIRQEIGHFTNVKVTKFSIDEVNEINLNHHITLIPTYGSEGTSLSLLEGMAAGCVPVASNVGGLTNIILDGYNGYLVNPSTGEFVKKLSFLIENPQILSQISVNAKNSLESSFSLSKWSKKWIEVINEIDSL